MFTETIQPGFSDTDALGHINNTRLPVWFENAREPIFKIFTPEMNLKEWPLILVSMSVDFKLQIYFNAEVEIKTNIKKIGRSSFTVAQQAWQNGRCVATGESIMVHFSYRTEQSIAIPEQIRELLNEHL